MRHTRSTRALLDNATIGLASAVLGLMAGFFWTYSFNVNPALLQVDGATYATVQSLLNRNVRHGAFFTLFFGGVLFPLLALAVNHRHWRTPDYWLLVAATVVYAVGIVVFTRQVNLPLNAYTESWTVARLPEDWTRTREAWNEANMRRVWCACAAFGLSLGAMVLRASPCRNDDQDPAATASPAANRPGVSRGG